MTSPGIPVTVHRAPPLRDEDSFVRIEVAPSPHADRLRERADADLASLLRDHDARNLFGLLAVPGLLADADLTALLGTEEGRFDRVHVQTIAGSAVGRVLTVLHDGRFALRPRTPAPGRDRPDRAGGAGAPPCPPAPLGPQDGRRGDAAVPAHRADRGQELSDSGRDLPLVGTGREWNRAIFLAGQIARGDHAFIGLAELAAARGDRDRYAEIGGPRHRGRPRKLGPGLEDQGSGTARRRRRTRGRRQPCRSAAGGVREVCPGDRAVPGSATDAVGRVHALGPADPGQGGRRLSSTARSRCCRINDDPGHLFGYWQTEKTGYLLMRAVGCRVHRFRDHINELLSTEEGMPVPNDMSAVPLRRPGGVCLR